MNWKRCIHLWGVILGLGFGATAMAQVPGVFHFSGQLDTNNGALTDTIDVQIALYDDPVLGGETHELWAEIQTVTVTQGRFHVLLGADALNPILPSSFQKQAVYVGITVGSDSEMTPRSRVGTVPYASLAGDAATLGGVSASSYVTQTELDSAGYVTGAHTVDTDTTRSNEEILTVVGPHTSYTGDKGVTLVGTEFSADTAFVQKRVTGTCSAGWSIRAIAADGAVTCEIDTDTQLTNSQVLGMITSGGYVDVVGSSSCTTDDIVKWNGSAWVCATATVAVQGKPFIGRSAERNTWNSSWQTTDFYPLLTGNHLTPTRIKLEARTTNSSYAAYVRYVFYYADNTSYTSSEYSTTNTVTAYVNLYEADIPVHASLRGSITRISLQVKSHQNSTNSYAYGRLTVSGHETSNTGLTAGKPFIGRSAERNTWNSSWQTTDFYPLVTGNHLTPTRIKLEARTTNSSYAAYVRYVFYYADNTNYTSSEYSTTNTVTAYVNLYEADIPIHDSLKGSITRISLQVKSHQNSTNSYAYGRLTVSGHETVP